MKSLIFTFSLSLISITASFAQTSEEISSGLVIENQIQERNEELPQDHYICLGDSWKKTNIYVHSKVRDIKILEPKLFKDIGPEQKNCFSPIEVPANLRKSIDGILSNLDSTAGDQFHIGVGTYGEIIPLSQTKEKSQKINEPGNEIALRNGDKSLARKLSRSELLVGGIEVIGMMTLIALPKSITKWSDDWQLDAKRNLKRAWTTAPVIDKDDWAINYIGHPYSGAIYYNALRSQGATRLQSFIFSSVQSTIWEYGFEAIAEQPSIQDLFITPIVGSFIGELAHLGTIRMARNGFNLGEKILVTIINPSYVINNGYKVKFKKTP